MKFFVTGFGPFAGVDTNPTQQLVDLLREHLQVAAADGDQGPAYGVLGTEVLEVSAKPARDWLKQLYSSQLPASSPALQEPIVVLHMGVDCKGDHLKLEYQAVNEAHFRVPDQAGWQPHQQLIDDHPGCGLGTQLHTDLNLKALTGRLQARHPRVCTSHDAGRFVCNWVYYLSLLHSQKQRQRRGRPLHALFLHVPPTTTVPLRQQFDFLLDLLQAIAEQLMGSNGNGSGSTPGTPVRGGSAAAAAVAMEAAAGASGAAAADGGMQQPGGLAAGGGAQQRGVLCELQ